MDKVKGRKPTTGRRARPVTAGGAPAYGLIDVASGNMVAGFASEGEALQAVAAAAREHGADSDAVLALSLFRWDVPSDEGFVADGDELVRRALAAGSVPSSTIFPRDSRLLR